MKKKDRSVRVLITGASGFLGHYLLKQAPNWALVYGQYYRNPIHVQKENVRPLQADLLSDLSRLFSESDPQVIVHTAALTSLDACQQNPALARELNVKVTEQLVCQAGERNSHLIYTSTDIVFDGSKGFYREEDPAHPVNVYGQTKLAAEQIVRQGRNPWLVVRPALMYGRSLGGRVSYTEVVLQKLLADQPVRLFKDEFRSPVWVEDVARFLWQAVAQRITGVIHLGGPERLSRWEMGLELARCFGLPANTIQAVSQKEVPTAAPRPADVSLESTLARRQFGYRPERLCAALQASFPRFSSSAGSGL